MGVTELDRAHISPRNKRGILPVALWILASIAFYGVGSVAWNAGSLVGCAVANMLCIGATPVFARWASVRVYGASFPVRLRWVLRAIDILTGLLLVGFTALLLIYAAKSWR